MSSDQNLSADVVIVGSGVAGSSIANELARAGISAIWKTSRPTKAPSRPRPGPCIHPTR